MELLHFCAAQVPGSRGRRAAKLIKTVTIPAVLLFYMLVEPPKDMIYLAAFFCPTQGGMSNQLWAMDFLLDALHNGRRFRALPIIDTFTRENLWIEVDTSITGQRVVQVLTRISAVHGLPVQIVVDNGPEFISNALDAWAYERGIKLQFIRPGKTVDNCFMESFNGRFRDECLNENWFMSLDQARKIIEDWRVDYNQSRLHSSLGDLTPAEFRLQELSKIGQNL